MESRLYILRPLLPEIQIPSWKQSSTAIRGSLRSKHFDTRSIKEVRCVEQT